MTVHLQREIERLKRRILIMGGEVEQDLQQAVRALRDWNMPQARQVIEHDAELDEYEVETEEECLKILALNQPVAIDLRFVVAVLKINNDLERIADLAVNIAERVLDMGESGRPAYPETLDRMVETAQEMLRASLDALVRMDAGAARAVIDQDDVLDDLHRDMYRQTERSIRENPDSTTIWINLLSISRYLERVGDQVTNIAEDIIYMVDGEVVRHRLQFESPHGAE